jgi:GDP-L-fucose synthase
MDNKRSTLELGARIYVAGHTGLVGSALVRALQRLGHENLILRHRRDLDLTRQADVAEFFAHECPEYVFLAAAKVGGIHANNTYPAEFIEQNLAIQFNIIREARRVGVKRLMFLGSSCIYPRLCPQPIKEEYLLTGPLESTNRPYAVAKIAGIEMCWAYNRQYRTRFLAVMPTNLFGEGDNYDLNSSHVVPALIRKMSEAKERGSRMVTVWGTGKPRRELLYSDDLANACLFLMGLPDENFDELTTEERTPLINIGAGEDFTIREIAEMIADVVGFHGELLFDATKPDGTPRKLLDCSRLSALGWESAFSLRAGLELTYKAYQQLTVLDAVG